MPRRRHERARRVVMLVLAVSAVGALFGAAMPAMVLAKSAAIAPPLAMTATDAMGSATPVLARFRPVIAGRGITTPTSCTASSAPRDPANPLMLATAPPFSDPLAGASFFVDGPT